MATAEPFVISLESELVTDAIRDLSMAYDAVIHRHGEAFRHLERRIEELVEAPSGVELSAIADGRFVITPPAEWMAILAEAKRLGVI